MGAGSTEQIHTGEATKSNTPAIAEGRHQLALRRPSHGEKRLLRLQRQLAGYKLLAIDELGYVPLSQTGGANALPEQPAYRTSLPTNDKDARKRLAGR
jgi:hypothetical protein